MTDTDLILLTQRVAARLPDVRDIVLREDGTDGWMGRGGSPSILVTGAYRDVATTVRVSYEGDATAFVEDACDTFADNAEWEEREDRPRVIPEIVLTEDTAITLGPHALRIAERREVVRQQPRTDGGYSRSEATRDLDNLVEALGDAYDSNGDCTPEGFRATALSLLAGMSMARSVQGTEGRAWLRAQRDASTTDDDARHGPKNGPVGAWDVPNASEAVASPTSVLEAPTMRYTETRTNGDATETRESLWRTAPDGTLVQVEPPRRGFDFVVPLDDPDTRDAAQVAALGACPPHPTILVGTTYAATEAGIVTLPDALPEDDATVWAEIVAGEEPTDSAGLATKYMRLLSALLATTDEAEDDRIREEMDEVWKEMASADYAEVERLTRHVLASGAQGAEAVAAELSEALLHPWQREMAKP